uniref:Uncharacterized protein n=1 Tax=Meloidogyne enterolobii TaxID=390850 RepID=A0A6V7Y659_MELEN|nr:unnamed protein product [Meloidogyne enterolobii]
MEEIIQSGGSTQLCLLFAALELSVLFAVFLFYICIKLFKPSLFFGNVQMNVLSNQEIVSEFNLPCFYQCFNCTFSPRHILKNCCKDRKIHKFLTCECIRPTIYGNSRSIDFVCCIV